MHFEFDTRDHLINCLKLTNGLIKLLAEYLEEKKVVTRWLNRDCRWWYRLR